MFSALEKNSIEHINIINILLDVHHQTLNQRSAREREKIRTFSVSSCVTRLYAIYESFIRNSLSDYLDALSEIVPFSELPDEFKKHYRIGISQILGNNQNHESLSYEDVIRWYHQAISENNEYTLVTQALTRHQNNFRLKIVLGLFNKVQLKNLEKWLNKHPQIIRLYPEGSPVYDSLESEINDFIQLRNDASHTVLENLESDGNLIRICSVTQALISAIAAYLRKSLLIKMLEAEKIKEIGVVSESLQQANAFVAFFEPQEVLTIRDTIYFIDTRDCFEEEITSMQLDGLNTTTVTTTNDTFEIGIRCSSIPRENTIIYSLIE
jgi:hypothetical protein